jgi:hypothetical protein
LNGKKRHIRNKKPILRKGTESMNTRIRFLLGLLSSLVLAPTGWAQVPAAPGVPALPAAPAAPANLWSFLLPNADQKASCKKCFCDSPIGKLTSGAAGPLSAMSGGLISNRCAKASIQNDIDNNPPGSSEGAAAAIKKDEADAKARRQAVRYLGTVDCNYWPEAKAALKNSLRKDPNECVRFEAALALRNGCCCNKEIIKALEMCVTGSDKDGNPPERSDRVRAAAADALARCPMLEEPEGTDKKNVDDKKTEAPRVNPNQFYGRAAQIPHEPIAPSARGVLVSLQERGKSQTAGMATGSVAQSGAAVPASAPIPAIYQRPGSISGIVANAFSADAASGSSTQTRQPFFSDLTKTLTGKQDYTVPARQENEIPSGNRMVRIPETRTVVPGEVRPAAPSAGSSAGQASEKITVVPGEVRPAAPSAGSSADRAGEKITVVPGEVRPAAPSGSSSADRPGEKKTVAPVEIIQPASNGRPSSGGPRETPGFVTIEEVSPSPSSGLPGATAIPAPRP